MNANQKLIQETYNIAVNILRENITKLGFSASTEKHANYFSVWARDHAITSLGALLTNDSELMDIAKRGILVLLKKQVDHGQVPSYIEIENGNRVYGGLGQITSIDSNLWVIICAANIFRKTKDKRFISETNFERYKKLYRLIKAFDSNNCGLIEVPRAGDWADIFNRTYHVLYDECLYYQALKDLKYLFSEVIKHQNNKKNPNKSLIKDAQKRIKWINKRKPQVKKKINEFFWFTTDNMLKIFDTYMIYTKLKPQNYPYYQSHITPFKIKWNNRFDSFGNILAIATQIADEKKSQKIIKYVLDNKINYPFPIKALFPAVRENDQDWEPIYKIKEQTHMYHNGGIWPVIAGFWIYVLTKNTKKKIAKQELLRFANQIKQQDNLFHEYLHGKTGEPQGRTKQAWSAAGFIIAKKSVEGKVKLFY